MRLFSILLSITFIFANTSQACSSFAFDTEASPIVGKAYDWDYGHGMAMINKRKMKKKALVVGLLANNPLKWTSKYGSLTFSQHGLEFPVSGINEAGLSIEVLWGDAEHPSSWDPRPFVNELQWVQYQLDSFATVEEVIAHADEIRIDPIYADVHYLVCDALGTCAAIEYLNGGLKVSTGETMPVRAYTNNTYQESIDYIKDFVGFGGESPIPTEADSLSRFVRVANGAKHYTADLDPVEHAFKVLDLAPESESDYEFSSKWNLVYQTNLGKAHFRTKHFRQIKEVDLSSFDYSCKTLVKVLEMEIENTGKVNELFVDFTDELNKALIAKNDYLSSLLQRVAASYPASNTQCVE